MAFDLTKLNKISSGANSLSFNMFSYVTADTRATIEGTGYFNDANDGYTGNGRLKIGDLLVVETTATVYTYRVTALTPNITVTQQTGAKFKGQFVTLGGDATEVISVPGLVAGDFVFTQLRIATGTPRTILTASAGTDQITVVFSGDPSTTHTLDYLVF